MAGLLDFLDMNTPQGQGFMNMAASLLQARDTPGATLGGALGRGLVSGMGAYQGAKQQAVQDEVRRMQIEEMKAAAEEAKRQRDEQAKFREIQRAALTGGGAGLPGAAGGTGAAGAGLPGGGDYFRPGGLASLLGGASLADVQAPPQAAAPQQPLTQELYRQRMLDALTQQGSPEALNYFPQAPKVKEYREMEIDGRPVTVALDEYGRRIGEPMAQWKAPIQIERGGSVEFASPVGLSGRSFTRTMTPGEIASNAIAQANLQRGYASDARAAAQAAAPIYDPTRGQFIFRPTAQAPLGSAMTPAGLTSKGAEANIQGARDSLALIQKARETLPGATGSLIGRGRDIAYQAFGKSTKGSEAASRLDVIGGMLTSKMPRMEGPQSDKDTESYRQMAGDVANSSKPVAQRLAALDALQEIMQRQAGYQAQTTPQFGAPAPGRQAPTAATGGFKILGVK